MTEQQRIDHYHHQADNLKVTLTRGRKGGYSWEIQVNSSSCASACYELDKIDATLRAKYAQEEKQP